MTSQSKWVVPGLALLLGLWLLAPELASAGNKFEIIGGGVAGSSTSKIEYVRWFGFGFGSFFLLAGVISLTSAHSNGLMMNYAVWKRAGIIWLVLSLISFGLAVLTLL